MLITSFKFSLAEATTKRMKTGSDVRLEVELLQFEKITHDS